MRKVDFDAIYEVIEDGLTNNLLISNRIEKINQMFKIIPILSIVCSLLSCKPQDDIRGTFVNDEGQEITIDCNYLIHSKHLSGRDFMPKNGDEIQLSQTAMGNQEITLSFNWNDMISPFAKWNTFSDEVSIGDEIYERKSFESCKKK